MKVGDLVHNDVLGRGVIHSFSILKRYVWVKFDNDNTDHVRSMLKETIAVIPPLPFGELSLNSKVEQELNDYIKSR